jgi:hypothetical protein
MSTSLPTLPALIAAHTCFMTVHDRPFNELVINFIGRSQWPRSLRHELSLPPLTHLGRELKFRMGHGCRCAVLCVQLAA